MNYMLFGLVCILNRERIRAGTIVLSPDSTLSRYLVLTRYVLYCYFLRIANQYWYVLRFSFSLNMSSLHHGQPLNHALSYTNMMYKISHICTHTKKTFYFRSITHNSTAFSWKIQGSRFNEKHIFSHLAQPSGEKMINTVVILSAIFRRWFLFSLLPWTSVFIFEQ